MLYIRPPSPRASHHWSHLTFTLTSKKTACTSQFMLTYQETHGSCIWGSCFRWHVHTGASNFEHVAYTQHMLQISSTYQTLICLCQSRGLWLALHTCPHLEGIVFLVLRGVLRQLVLLTCNVEGPGLNLYIHVNARPRCTSHGCVHKFRQRMYTSLKIATQTFGPKKHFSKSACRCSDTHKTEIRLPLHVFCIYMEQFQILKSEKT